MEDTEENKRIDTKLSSPKRKIFRNVSIIIIAITLGYIHYRYVSYLFENDRNFSFLSELEREMSLRTEMGFYYSYYKTVVEERPFIAGISKLMYDRLVEYPKEVNAFNRFNIHPEVIIGSLYRYFEPRLNTTAYRQCHMIDRGEGLAPVESCVGVGHPIMFYLEAIWWLAGLTVTAIFLHGTLLSDSIFGGLLTVAQYFANHAECTRVQWAPNERENFAAPLLILHSILVSEQLRDRDRKSALPLQVSIFILNCLCLLFWQFTQFIFLTQIAIFFVMEQLRIIDIKSLCIFLHSHFCGLHMAVLLLQGNDMLKSSLYTSFFIVVSVYSLFFSTFRIKVLNKLDLFVESWLVVLRISLVICASFYLKKIISDFLEVQEDSHVWDILISKFTDYKSFHTLIYTCSEVFDYLPWKSIKKMHKTFLIPYAIFVTVNLIKLWFFNAAIKCSEQSKKEIDEKQNLLEKDKANVSNNIQDDEDSGIENNSDTKVKEGKKISKDLDLIDKDIKSKLDRKTKDKLMSYLKNLKIEPAIFYNLSQMAVYGVMAGLVMRLKLLFTTQMCIISSLMITVNKNFGRPKVLLKYLPLFWLLNAMLLLRETYNNMKDEMANVGEFYDVPQEQLLEWIANATSASAAFAGSMPVLATVMLTTRRPIVAHPHYEHLEARQRAYAVYKTYGRFSSLELYQELTKLKASYLIVETKYCYGRSSKGCSFEDIWDIEVPALRDRPKLCHTLLTEPVDHFYPVFRNGQYAVFRIHDFSVRYMPRSFDT